MPGMFKHAGVKFGNLISMTYMCTEGIFSSILGVSTDQVFIFLLFGQLLETLGGSEFFWNGRTQGLENCEAVRRRCRFLEALCLDQSVEVRLQM